VAVVVVLDACVLHPAALRDFLMRLAIAGLIRARWSETIMDEWERSVLRVVEGVSPDALRRTRELMKKALPDADVTGLESLIDRIELPDADDRHVVAAAMRGGAQAIATFNLKDFPAEKLATHGVEAQHPDDLVLDLVDVDPGAVLAVVRRQAAALKNPPMTVDEVLARLEEQGLVRSVARLRELSGVTE